MLKRVPLLLAALAMIVLAGGGSYVALGAGRSAAPPAWERPAAAAVAASSTPVPTRDPAPTVTPARVAVAAAASPVRTAAPPPPTPTPAPTATPAVEVRPLSGGRILNVPAHEYQRWNNCGPVSTLMDLSYFGIRKTQTEVAAAVRPHPDDKNTTPEELVGYIQSFGLHAIVRENGSMELFKRLIENDIPVIAEQWLGLPLKDHIGHLRVIRGYNDRGSIFVSSDSMYGPEYRMPYSDFDSLGAPYNNLYIVAYPPDWEPVVKAILGPNFDEVVNRQRSVESAGARATANPRDPELWVSYGQALTAVERYEEAVAAFEKARAIGLEPHALWWMHWPLVAYNAVGRPQQAIALANEGMVSNAGASELLLQRARAYQAQGRLDLARRDLQEAVKWGPYYETAHAALAALPG